MCVFYIYSYYETWTKDVINMDLLRPCYKVTSGLIGLFHELSKKVVYRTVIFPQKCHE